MNDVFQQWTMEVFELEVEFAMTEEPKVNPCTYGPIRPKGKQFKVNSSWTNVSVTYHSATN